MLFHEPENVGFMKWLTQKIIASGREGHSPLFFECAGGQGYNGGGLSLDCAFDRSREAFILDAVIGSDTLGYRYVDFGGFYYPYKADNQLILKYEIIMIAYFLQLNL